MTHTGVEPRFIVGYINRSMGMKPINAQDVICLHEQGVSPEVIETMLRPAAAYSRTDVVCVCSDLQHQTAVSGIEFRSCCLVDTKSFI